MCGIAGFHAASSPPEEVKLTLERMVASLDHRGPDEHGTFIDGRTGLGHTRLSIIDLSSGQQPMLSADGHVCVSFNGEIFNYVELREAMIRRGHRFRTDSDTEVILKAYEEKGVDCVGDFNGDFAFAIWDKRAQRLILARDRMGVRPLYYTRRTNGLFFASEVKALLTVPGV